MGQVAKYVTKLCPRAVKVLIRPSSKRWNILLLVQQFGLVACLLVFSLIIGGVSWQPRTDSGGVWGLIEQSRLAVTQVLQPVLGLNPQETSPPDAASHSQEITPGDEGTVTAGSKEPLNGQLPEVEAPGPPGLFPESPEVSLPPPPAVEVPQEGPEPAYVRSVAAAGKRVALTFDDGPFPEWTERYLRVLEVTQTPATFFMVGRQAASQPGLVNTILAAGHEVASHSWRHANLGEVSLADAEADLRQAVTSLEEITGEPVKYFRPPYGALSPNLLAAAKNIGVRTVNWSVDPRDWSNPGPNVVIQRVMDNVFEGSIILLHEAHPGTLTALPVLIKNLRDQGFELVTVSELIASGHPRQD